jgi:hypothetical protein
VRDDGGDGPKLSGTVRKAFQILDHLSASQSELAPREIAQHTGLDRTTVYRLPRRERGVRGEWVVPSRLGSAAYAARASALGTGSMIVKVLP